MKYNTDSSDDLEHLADNIRQDVYDDIYSRIPEGSFSARNVLSSVQLYMVLIACGMALVVVLSMLGIIR